MMTTRDIYKSVTVGRLEMIQIFGAKVLPLFLGSSKNLCDIECHFHIYIIAPS